MLGQEWADQYLAELRAESAEQARLEREAREPGRFGSKVDRSGECWLWTDSCNWNGYGRFSRAGGAYVRAHRWAYETFVGPIPDELEIDHLCRVRRCVNPDTSKG